MSHLRDLEWLHDELRSESSGILVLDCRLQTDYAEGHIRGAINVTLPSLLLRRLASGKLAIASLIKCNDSREKFVRNWKTHTIVLYGDLEDERSVEGSGQNQSGVVMLTLYNRLQQDGCQVVCLQGVYSEFRVKYPEWCSCISERCVELDGPFIGLQNLRISPTPMVIHHHHHHYGSDNESTASSADDFCDSCLDLSGESPPFQDSSSSSSASSSCPFPVEILPNLFLGNARNSADLEALERHKIRYILNVTSDLPNIFKHDPHIRYLQIPISDHWSQNLASFFPQAIAFIDEARQKQLGVLVHCLAGISRSVTITVAYLMHKFSMTLNDAFEFVKKRQSNISPNFSFMGQLLDYEKELNLNPASSTLPQLPPPPPPPNPSNKGGPSAVAGVGCCCPPDIPCVCISGTTPDSGIDIGNWV